MVVAVALVMAAPMSQLNAQNRTYDQPAPCHQYQELENPDFALGPQITEHEIAIKSIFVYPNLARDFLNIDLGNNVASQSGIGIYNLLGH